MVGLGYYSKFNKNGQPQCPSRQQKQDCPDSPQKHPHASHCRSCHPHAHREHQGAQRHPPNPLKIFMLLYDLSYTGESPGSPGRYAAGCSQERAAPMSQLASETRELRKTAEAPTRKPKPERPPTTA